MFFSFFFLLFSKVKMSFQRIKRKPSYCFMFCKLTECEKQQWFPHVCDFPCHSGPILDPKDHLVHQNPQPVAHLLWPCTVGWTWHHGNWEGCLEEKKILILSRTILPFHLFSFVWVCVFIPMVHFWFSWVWKRIWMSENHAMKLIWLCEYVWGGKYQSKCWET